MWRGKVYECGCGGGRGKVLDVCVQTEGGAQERSSREGERSDWERRIADPRIYKHMNTFMDL